MKKMTTIMKKATIIMLLVTIMGSNNIASDDNSSLNKVTNSIISTHIVQDGDWIEAY